MSKNIPQNRYKITIDGKDYTKYIPMPVKWSSLLDERLDEGRLSMRHCPVKLFEPLSEVDIIFTDMNDVEETITFLVSVDESAEAPAGSGFYNHEISLIEETKKLEGIITETLSFTNSLGRTYTDNPVKATPIYDNEYIQEVKKVYLTPIKINDTIVISSMANTIIPKENESAPSSPNYGFAHFDNTPISIVAINPNNEIETIVYGKADKANLNKNGTVKLNLNGIWEIHYRGTMYKSGLNGYKDKPFDVNFQIAVVSNEQPLPKWTVASVIDRLLDLAVPHLKSGKAQFKLNDAQHEEFSKIEAPEFAFTKMTLKEALDQVGGFIHGVPRLKGNTIYYDMLGGTEHAALADPKYPYITDIHVQSIESYATKLDSTVDNLVNILDSDEGVITEPYAGGYKTVRSEEAYARITDGNMIIETTLPVYAVSKLEVGPLPDGSTGDITPYLFESARYGALSSFDGDWPLSKAFALYYTQGQKNIQGLSFKAPNVIGGAGAKYAIANIIKRVTDYDVTPDWWESGNDSNYPKLSFRITYTPVFSARVEQHKLYYKDFKHPRTLAYNQGANLVETRFYGENMKGAIARTGNAERIRTYRLQSTRYIPKVGQLWGDDYYVSGVSVEILPMYINCTVQLSKDFNRLSQYIGINSMHRMYEVSEKQAYNRDMVYSDYIVIGDKEESDNLHLIGETGLLDIRDTFYQKGWLTGYTGPITCAGVTTLDEDENEIVSLTLPAVSTAMGNALVFSFYMEDNFSAGRKSVKGDNGEVSGYWQTDVSYNDYYGRFKYMKLHFAKLGRTPQYDSDIGFNLPQGDYTSGTSQPGGVKEYLLATPENDPLTVDKNSTEIIRGHYQIHYVSNRKDIIVGPALTHNCPLVRGVKKDNERGSVLYVLSKPLGKFTDKVDLTDATQVFDYSAGHGIDVIDNTLQFYEQYATADGVAWAICDKATGELLLGSNTALKAGERINLPVFTAKHNIYSEV